MSRKKRIILYIDHGKVGVGTENDNIEFVVVDNDNQKVDFARKEYISDSEIDKFFELAEESNKIKNEIKDSSRPFTIFSPVSKAANGTKEGSKRDSKGR